jgi:hypothetical protein
MSHYGYYIDSDSDIAHHGVKGMKWGVRKNIQRHVRKRAEDWMAVRDLKVKSRKNISDLRSALKNTNDRSKRREYRKQIFANNRDIAYANLPLPMAEKAKYARATNNNKRLDSLSAPLAVANPLMIAPNAISNMSQNAAIAYTNRKVKKSK